MNDRSPLAGAIADDRLTILVVEDEVLIRLDICDELRSGGFTVLEAASVNEALDLLRSGRQVDAVFSDYQLIGALDGWDLHRSVTDAHPETAFVLTSAQSLKPEWQDAGVRFVPKPYRADEVVAEIRRAIRDH